MSRAARTALVVLGSLALVLLVGPFLVPVPPLQGTSPSRALADADSRFVELDGVAVHYKLYGDGDPLLVLLHGFAASVFSWREVVEPLSTWGTVVAFDRPGQGLTERPRPGEWSGESPYSRASQVDMTIALMDALGARRAILVGHSAGGTVALLTALAHPDRVQGLILVDPAVYVTGGAPSFLGPLLRTPQARRLGLLFVRRIGRWGDDILESSWHDPAKITPEILDGYVKALRADDWDRGLWELTAATSSDRLGERLHEIVGPVLVVTGDDDQIVPTEQSVRLAEELPDAELVVIPACGHVPHEEQPKLFLDAAHAFLDRITTD